MKKVYIIKKLKTIVIPGFDGVPIYNVLDFFFKGVVNGAITTRASAISFSMFSALFPALIFFFTLIPFIPIENFQDVLLELIHDITPNKAWEAIDSTVVDIVKRPRGGLLSLGFVLALFFATNGINSMIDAFNASYHTMEFRGIFMQRWVAIVLVLVLAVLLIVVITTIVIGTTFFNYLDAKDLLHDNFVVQLIQWFRWIALLALTYFGISFIYYWGPAKKTPFKFLSAGSSLVAILMMISNIGFNFYANNLATYNALYGSIGTLLLVLLWVYFNSIIVLIGFELNASIYNAALKVKGIDIKMIKKQNEESK
ncbi:YihY/virulence factor BrkB family protein [Lentimicrobium sp. L6]|uniref:YihY/virulence factor BrkB family protein n=1 Tax=Lentimicrobium sp. L6 TaxID=2735916 RepID=UPI0015516672|nr:YihY/virulence factor BrkB family protein [Lentimicrobium sp. L6]NPD83532.1 YihY/virulence factor BrkB family protein [Lentimicrobium sp. L6]